MHHATAFWGLLDSICLQFTWKTTFTRKVFSERMSNVFVCGDFNSTHRELNSSYDCENGEKLLNLIEKGHFKLLNNGHYTYQSVDGKSRNMLDLHLCDSTVFTNFNNFEVSEDIGSDHRTTITTLNLKISKMFELKSNIDLRILKKTQKSFIDYQYFGLRCIQERMI